MLLPENILLSFMALNMLSGETIKGAALRSSRGHVGARVEDLENHNF